MFAESQFPKDRTQAAVTDPAADRYQFGLTSMLSVLLLIGPAVLIGLIVRTGEVSRLLGTLPFVVLGVAIGVLLHLGYRRAALSTLVYGAWICTVNGLVWTQGLTGTTFGALVVTLVFASWMAGPWASILLTAATPPILFLMAYLEVNGWPIAVGAHVTPYQRALVFSLTAMAGGALGYFGAASNRERLTRLKDAQRDLNAQLAELEARGQELQLSQNRFENIFRFSPNALVITNPQGHIIDCNQVFEQLVGHSKEKLLSHTTLEFGIWRHPEERQRAYDFLARDETLIAFEGQWNNAAGSVRTVLVYGTPMMLHLERCYVFHILDITERKVAEGDIQRLAFSDSLTKLANRRCLIDRLHHAIAAKARDKHQSALMLIDLDNFKSLNDTLGHNVGDLLLQQVAQRLNATVRETDTVARLGGDEFVVLLENLSEPTCDAMGQVETIGAKILAQLNLPYQLGSHQVHSTPSIGITLFHDKHNSVDDLMKRADLAMYQAKSAGRNALRFFDPQMQAVVTARVQMEADLRLGLQLQQFELHYQPQVDAAGHLQGAEALLRWRHPERGLVPPAHFIPLAEETGLIRTLGLWVLESACAQLVRWAAHPATAHLTLAVNVSARQIYHPDFVAQVVQAIHHSGVNPRQLTLELTESLLLDNVEDIIAKMTALQARGVGFSLDDFGTGYSSLTYLKRLPLNQLKIDSSFVRDVLTDPNDASIAITIITLARSLGLKVIAEGVETQAQKDFLAEQGCLAYQGYYFSQALPAPEFEAYAKAQGAAQAAL